MGGWWWVVGGGLVVFCFVVVVVVVVFFVTKKFLFGGVFPGAVGRGYIVQIQNGNYFHFGKTNNGDNGFVGFHKFT